jgi:streptogramin lyase
VAVHLEVIVAKALHRRIGVRLVGSILAGALVATGAAAQSLGGVAVEHDGGIVVVRRGIAYDLVRVDPVTGAVSVVSSSTVGSGPSLQTANDVAVETSGALIVTEPFVGFQKVLRVDPATGDRAILSGLGAGSGPLFFPISVAVAPNGDLFVTQDQEFGADAGVLRVDPSTGDRSFVSSSTQGAGPAWKAPVGIAGGPGGALFVVDTQLDAVLRVDAATGDRTTISGAGVGSGPPLRLAVSLTAAPGDSLLVLDNGGTLACVPFCPSELCQICLEIAPSIVRVDPGTGNRTNVSGGGECLTFGLAGCVTPYLGHTGRGLPFVFLADIAVEPTGSYVVTDSGFGRAALVRVDPATGRRRTLAQLGPTSAQTAPDGRGPRRLDGGVMYRVRDPQAWLRRALGGACDVEALMARPDRFFAALPPAARRAVGEKLRDAILRLMAATPRPSPTSSTARDTRPRSPS